MKLPYILTRLFPAACIFALTVMTTLSLSAADLKLIEHRIEWKGSTPVKSHEGLLSPKSFDVSLGEDGTIESLSVIIDMDSIDVTDISGNKRDKLMGHLRSEDFFYVSEYPTASFTMAEFKDGQLHGTITIRGITKDTVIPVNIEPVGDNEWKLSGEFSFNRHDFDVNYQNSGLIGATKNKFIRKAIKVDVELLIRKD
jgi:hypothetical protein